MILSDVSIKRPVFATVMSLLLVVLGLIAFTRLTLRELPNIDPPIVSVEVNYPGASAAVVETRVTQILEDGLSGIEGIKTIQSSSRNGRSDVTIEFNLSRDIEAAANDGDAMSQSLWLRLNATMLKHMATITLESWTQVIEVTTIETWSAYSYESFSYSEFYAEYSTEISESYASSETTIEESITSEEFTSEMTSEETVTEETVAEDTAT